METTYNRSLHTSNDNTLIIDVDDDETFWASSDVTESLTNIEFDQIDYVLPIPIPIPNDSFKTSLIHKDSQCGILQPCGVKDYNNSLVGIHSRPNEPYFRSDEPLSPLKTFVSLQDLENDPNLSYMSDYFKSQFDGVRKTFRKRISNEDLEAVDEQNQYKKSVSRKNTWKNGSDTKKRPQYKAFSKRKPREESIDDE